MLGVRLIKILAFSISATCALFVVLAVARAADQPLTGFGDGVLGMSEADFMVKPPLGATKLSSRPSIGTIAETRPHHYETETAIDGTVWRVWFDFTSGVLTNISVLNGESRAAESCRQSFEATNRMLAGKYGQFDGPPASDPLFSGSGFSFPHSAVEVIKSYPDRSLKVTMTAYQIGNMEPACTIGIFYHLGSAAQKAESPF